MARVKMQGFERALSNQLNKIHESVSQATEDGLDKAADYVVEIMVSATPSSTGLFRSGETKKNWDRTFKYKRVRYITNSSLNDRNIPIINLLEFSRKGKPFIRETFSKNRATIEKLLLEDLKR